VLFAASSSIADAKSPVVDRDRIPRFTALLKSSTESWAEELRRLLQSVSLTGFALFTTPVVHAADQADHRALTIPVPNPIYAFDSTVGGWRPNNGRWYAYTQSRDPCPTELGGFPNNPISPPSCFIWLTGTSGQGKEWVVSEGPWWVDPNHAHDLGGNGFGYIHVVAFSQIPAAHLGPVNLNGTTVTFDARVSGSFATLPAAHRYGIEHGHVYLWFQTYPRHINDCTPNPEAGENCTRQSNYILTGDSRSQSKRFQIDSLSAGNTVTFSYKIDADRDANWTCLGRGRNVKYDCLPISAALRQAAVIGLVVAPVPTCPTRSSPTGEISCDLARIDANPSAYFASGRIAIRNFKLAYDSLEKDVASHIQFPNMKKRRLPDTWSSKLTAMNELLEVKSGIHVPSPPSSGAVAIGLSPVSTGAIDTESLLELRLSKAGSQRKIKEDIVQVVIRKSPQSTPRELFVAPFERGDNFGIHIRDSDIVFLKNGSALHTESSPCSTGNVCRFTPYIRLLGDSPTIRAYRY
jgi:hypothetical protein